MAYAIKADIPDPSVTTFRFKTHKTMYAGKHIAVGDEVFLFASETQVGQGLLARGVVTSAKAVARSPGVERETPRVSVTVRRTALAWRLSSS